MKLIGEVIVDLLAQKQGIPTAMAKELLRFVVRPRTPRKVGSPDLRRAIWNAAKNAAK